MKLELSWLSYQVIKTHISMKCFNHTLSSNGVFNSMEDIYATSLLPLPTFKFTFQSLSINQDKATLPMLRLQMTSTFTREGN